jgi:hypothetical protein
MTSGRFARNQLLWLILLSVPGPGLLRADAIARTGGALALPLTVNPASGPGGVCAYAHSDTIRDPKPPAGQVCNNNTLIGPLSEPPQEPIIDKANTMAIGNGEGHAFGGPGGLNAGERIHYNRTISDDKVAAAKANGGVFTMTQTALGGGPPPLVPFAQATATQTMTAAAGGFVTGLATAEVKRPAPPPGPPPPGPPPPIPGFAVGIINDPLMVTGTGTVRFDLSTLSLQANQPGDFSDGFIELASSTTGVLLSLDIHIDSSTTSLGNVDFNFDAYNPMLGFSTPGDFVAHVLDPNFTFDSATHTLRETSPFTLFSLPISSGDGNVEVTFNYGAFAGETSIPEPHSVGLFLVGLAGLVLARYSSFAGGRAARRRRLMQ